ncbi:MAG: two-component system, chemotaxis family, CheB/CheR fusion protein [Betaproteobacteria bacterium]
MNIATEVIRAEPHLEIGSLLQRDAAAIVERWCKVAREEEPAAKRVHHDVLRDQLAEFLEGVGTALKQTGRAATNAHRKAAKEHGEQRWDSGWSLPELVRDYQVMRLVILEYLEANLDRPLYYRESMAVGVFIDDAVAESIARYVAYRDEHMRGIEGERTRVLEDLSRRKDEFLAILGHELRNPLAPIRNSVVILRQLASSMPHPAVATSLDVLDRQSQQLGRLIDDLLDLGRISRGEFELRKTRTDLRNAIEQALQMNERLIASRRHQLDLAMPASPLYVEADPNRITQIVANLLNNAAKYTEPDGRIWLSVEIENSSAVLRVRDNGIGIAPEMLTRVFDLFARVEQPSTSGREGLGIGLALVQRLVQQHGGTISAASAGLGQGAEFTVRLPMHGAPTAKQPVEATASGADHMLVIKQVLEDRH